MFTPPEKTEKNSAGRSLHTAESLRGWLDAIDRENPARVEAVPPEACGPWFYDGRRGELRTPSSAFFQIGCVEAAFPSGALARTPFLFQNEIGLLGILCRDIGGVRHYLLQAKPEPGNENGAQLAPTVQATESNLRRRHGGRAPARTEAFRDVAPERTVLDLLQPEYASVFCKKRNRHVVVCADGGQEEDAWRRWVSAPQLRSFLFEGGLVNADTRFVLSSLTLFYAGRYFPLPGSAAAGQRAAGEALSRALETARTAFLPRLRRVPLPPPPASSLRFSPAPGFDIGFFRVSIGCREVPSWNQPLVMQPPDRVSGLLVCGSAGYPEVLVRVGCAVGAPTFASVCPTVGGAAPAPRDPVEARFLERLARREGVLADVALSDDGGRFYRSRRRYVLMSARKEELPLSEAAPYRWISPNSLRPFFLTQALDHELRELLLLLAWGTEERA